MRSILAALWWKKFHLFLPGGTISAFIFLFKTFSFSFNPFVKSVNGTRSLEDRALSNWVLFIFEGHGNPMYDSRDCFRTRARAHARLEFNKNEGKREEWSEHLMGENQWIFPSLLYFFSSSWSFMLQNFIITNVIKFFVSFFHFSSRGFSNFCN